MRDRIRPFIGILSIAYAIVMLWLLFGQRLDNDFSGSYIEQLKSAPIPFQTILQFGRILLTGEPAELVGHALQNFLGNVLMFVPLGVCLPF